MSARGAAVFRTGPPSQLPSGHEGHVFRDPGDPCTQHLNCPVQRREIAVGRPSRLACKGGVISAITTTPASNTTGHAGYVVVVIAVAVSINISSPPPSRRGHADAVSERPRFLLATTPATSPSPITIRVGGKCKFPPCRRI